LEKKIKLKKLIYILFLILFFITAQSFGQKKIIEVHPRLLGVGLSYGSNTMYCTVSPLINIRPSKYFELGISLNTTSLQGFGFSTGVFFYPTGYRIPFKKSLSTSFPRFFQPSFGLFYSKYGENYIGVEDSAGFKGQIKLPKTDYLIYSFGCKIDYFSMLNGHPEGNVAFIGGISYRQKMSKNNAQIDNGNVSQSTLTNINSKLKKTGGFYIGVLLYIVKTKAKVRIDSE
jgi:hypothetical protein